MMNEKIHKPIFYAMIIIALLAASYGAFLLLFGSDTLLELTREDGFFETITALGFLASSMLFFISYMGSKTQKSRRFLTRRNIILLMLALLMFGAFGEEISWGQRLFGFITPPTIAKENAQQEFNIHNLWLFDRETPQGKEKTGLALFFTVDRMYALFILGFFIIIPLLAYISARFAHLMERIRFPVFPLWLGMFFVLNYMLSKTLFITRSMIDPITEIKECNNALIFLAIAAYSHFNMNHVPSHAHAEHPAHARHKADAGAK